jgi:hypothetical protein
LLLPTVTCTPVIVQCLNFDDVLQFFDLLFKGFDVKQLVTAHTLRPRVLLLQHAHHIGQLSSGDVHDYISIDMSMPEMKPGTSASNLKSVESQHDAHARHARRYLVTCTPDAWSERFTVSRFSDSDVDRILTILKNEGTYDTQLGWKPNQLFALLSQLGFDPTVKAVVSDGNTPLCWEFTIEGSTYRTVGLPLAHATTYYPFSRARRVFKVHPAVDGKVLDVTYVAYTFHTSARFLVLLRVIHRAPIYSSRPELLVRKIDTLPERERDTLVKKTENTPRNESDQRHH